MNNEILTVKNLKTYFLVNKSKRNPIYVRAVDGVSFSIKEGEIMGLAGESGSGKSTIAYTIMGIYKAKEGEILFDGENVIKKNNKRDFSFKKNVQLSFQDAGSSLNPCQNLRQILSLPLKLHKIVPKEQIENKIYEVLEMVGLPKHFIYEHTNSISGGQKQLVSIARALSTNPKFIILDEPTSSLDVSTQAKIISKLLKLHKEQKFTCLFISHDLSLIRNVVTKVAILYLGKICEIAPTEILYKNLLHPYTQMLFSSIPVISEEEEALKPKKVVSVGEIPSSVNITTGCSFYTRCNQRLDICCREDPEIIEIAPNHFVRCHLFNKK